MCIGGGTDSLQHSRRSRRRCGGSLQPRKPTPPKVNPYPDPRQRRSKGIRRGMHYGRTHVALFGPHPHSTHIGTTVLLPEVLAFTTEFLAFPDTHVHIYHLL